MSRPPTSRAWIALMAGIVAGYAVLIALFWYDDDIMMAVAMGLSFLALVPALQARRRGGCTPSDADGG